MIVTAAAILVACGGKGTTPKAEDANAPQTEVKAPKAEEGDALAQYEKMIEKVIEIYPKVKTGDASAMAEYQKIATEMAPLATKITEEMANMTPEQQARFAELAQKLAAAAQ